MTKEEIEQREVKVCNRHIHMNETGECFSVKIITPWFPFLYLSVQSCVGVFSSQNVESADSCSVGFGGVGGRFFGQPSVPTEFALHLRVGQE